MCITRGIKLFRLFSFLCHCLNLYFNFTSVYYVVVFLFQANQVFKLYYCRHIAHALIIFPLFGEAIEYRKSFDDNFNSNFNRELVQQKSTLIIPVNSSLVHKDLLYSMHRLWVKQNKLEEQIITRYKIRPPTASLKSNSNMSYDSWLRYEYLDALLSNAVGNIFHFNHNFFFRRYYV